MPRCGRLIDTADGLVDLATGLHARLTCDLVTEDVVARTVRDGDCLGITVIAGGGEACIDAWFTRNWLGRWQHRRLFVRDLPVGHGVAAVGPTTASLDCDTHIGVTRAGMGAWLTIAAEARAHGFVPVHASVLTWLGGAIDRWPPLVIGVPTGGGLHAHAARESCARGAVATLVSLPEPMTTAKLPCQPPPSVAAMPPAARLRFGVPGTAARGRHLRRAWQALPRAPMWPLVTWIPSTAGGRIAMTHLELLDVSTQIEDARRDDEALLVGCRAARQHTRADHAAIVSVAGALPEVVASDGPPGDSPAAWRHLCRDEGPRELVSSSGWHTAARHVRDDGASVWVCGRWATREQGGGVCELLSVFARLVAPRVCAVPPRRPGAAGLEETLVGSSTVMHDVRAQIALAARAPFPVLIRGESGCGKELAARAIHALGPRRHRRCGAINCAALPDDLIESELFGHVRGAFTGAATDRAGLFDDADGGTLFLDEVGELGARAQAKLLRVLQDGEVRRVGENHARRVDVRVIAATNLSLEDAVRRGAFRADLFYRLDVVRVRMPALRERREDIPLLARHFWRECTARLGSRARLEGRPLDLLTRYDWPGNVRQLQNILAALAVRAPVQGRVSVDDLPPEVRHADRDGAYTGRGGLDAARREFEATYVRDALSRAGGRPSMAARDLGVTRQGLSKLVRRLGLDEQRAGPRVP